MQSIFYKHFFVIYFILLSKITHCNELNQFDGSSCIANDFITEFQLLYPIDGTLVRDVYYKKVEVDLLISIEEFQKRNSEFVFCVKSYLLPTIGNVADLIFEKCDVNGFDTLAIPGQKGWNYLVITLYHNNIELCRVNATVECCEIHEKQVVNNIEHHKIKLESIVSIFDELDIPKASSIDSIDNFSMVHYWKSVFVNEKSNNIRIPIGIKSSVYNLKYRKTIRNTWFQLIKQHHQQRNTILSSRAITYFPFFIIGKSSIDDSILDSCLKSEQYEYKDTLLGSDLHGVEDSYHTLTEKVLAFMHWIHLTSPYSAPTNINTCIDSSSDNITNNCYFDYVIICDDDVFLDIAQLSRFIHNLHRNVSKANNFYGGEVLEYRMNHKYNPQRGEEHRNYLSVEQYPLDTLLPFALGNFYLLSASNALFIAKNFESLQPMGTLEDVSVAVWMMSLQVFPEDIPGVCEVERCQYHSDLFEIMLSHNEESEWSTATTTDDDDDDDDDADWKQRIIVVAGLKDPYEFELLFNYTKYRTIHYSDSDHQDVLYILRGLLNELKLRKSGSQNDQELTLMQTGFSQVHEQYQLLYMNQIDMQSDDAPNRFLSQEILNIVIGGNSIYTIALIRELVSLAYSIPSNTIHWYVLKDNSILRLLDPDDYLLLELLPEDYDRLEIHTTILVLSVLDCMVNSPQDPISVDIHSIMRLDHLPLFVVDFLWTQASEECLVYSRQTSRADFVIFISGEVIDLSHMQNTEIINLFLLCSDDKKYLPILANQTSTVVIMHMPVFVTAFFEMNRYGQSSSSCMSYYSPHDLLLSSYERSLKRSNKNCSQINTLPSRTRGVAYLYRKCNRPLRELFFNLLSDRFRNKTTVDHIHDPYSNKLSTVDAIGFCYGATVDASRIRHTVYATPKTHNNDSSSSSTSQPEESRYTTSYIDRAIEIYQHYKFVIAFENSRSNGYITEKLITAYLAGAIPIYWGAANIYEYFHPKSMINCDDYTSLVDCVDQVLAVHTNDTLYEEMRHVIPIQGETVIQRSIIYSRLFPWENNGNSSRKRRSNNNYQEKPSAAIDNDILTSSYNKFKHILERTITKLN